MKIDLNKIKSAIVQFIKKNGSALPDKGAGIVAKVNKVNLGKVLGAAGLANVADDMASATPIINTIYQWVANTWDDVYEATVRQIPGVGDILRGLTDFLNSIIVPGAQHGIVEHRKVRNHPSFYGHLDLHKTFSIPGAYTKKTMINGTMGIPKLVVHRVVENPMPDKSATVDRVNQKYSLIKAVRGLSATVYNIKDLYNYERYAKLILLQYFTVKKVIQAAKTYSLVQTSIGDNIIKAYGFVASEVRDNLASYETLLCQMHRFIQNNLPVSGTWIDRLEYLVSANIPDYSDAKVATIHMFAVSMNSVFYSNANKTASFVFDCIPSRGNNSYNVLATNFRNYQDALVANDNWQQLIADYFGAFGSAVMWSDEDYPDYAKPLDLKNADNDLNREQIKNALYTNARLELITINPGVANRKFTLESDDAEPFQFPTYDFPQTFDATVLSARVAPNYDTILNYDCYLASAYSDSYPNLGNTNVLLVPDLNGIGAQTFTVTNTAQVVSMNNHETVYTLHKDKYTEEEALDISQFKTRSIGLRYALNDDGDTIYAAVYHKTHEYAIQDSKVYVFHDYGAGVMDFEFQLQNEAICDDDLQDTESAIDFPEEIMCWALIDWMPLAHFTFFGYVSATQSYFPRDIALLDMDAYGSLDDKAFATSINYSIYSLLATNLTIGKKRVDNLASVYKDKPNRRG